MEISGRLSLLERRSREANSSTRGIEEVEGDEVMFATLVALIPCKENSLDISLGLVLI